MEDHFIDFNRNIHECPACPAHANGKVCPASKNGKGTYCWDRHTCQKSKEFSLKVSHFLVGEIQIQRVKM